MLNSALAAEHFAIAAYTAAMPLLEGVALDTARRFLAQERAHAARLRELVADLGSSAAAPAPSYDFDSPADAVETLRLLLQVERKAIVVYGSVVPRIADSRLRQAVASIATTEAEHDAVLRLRLGRWPAPTPFVTGGA
nr:DUF4439 domain-containing protein [Conexibacter arvalis]